VVSGEEVPLSRTSDPDTNSEGASFGGFTGRDV
jgi:hypothetical protein